MKNWLIIAWKNDPAAKGIYSELELILDIDIKMEIISENPLFLPSESYNDVDRLIVLSKHASSQNIPALTVHTPGNWTKDNSYGGEKEKISYCDPLLNSLLIRKIDFYASLEGLKSYYDVVFEVTHHGPTLDVPVTFVEIGSTSKEWKDPRAHKVIAKAINNALKEYNNYKIEGYVGIGGPHYARVFTIYCLEKGYNIGHIIPKYVFDEINFEKTIFIAKERTLGYRGLLIEWKGLKKEFKDVLREKFEKEIIKIK